MKRLEYWESVADLFRFKIISDEFGNEFVVLKNSKLERIAGVRDKTEFEAIENHVHILDNIKKGEFERLLDIGQVIGNAVLHSLTIQYPTKQFVIFVTINLHDSMIIRFHQKWENEAFYYDPVAFTAPDERVFRFESEALSR